MSQKKILEAASKLFKSAPMLRGGIVMGIQLVRDSLQLTAEQKEDINQAIDIISGVSNYRKPAPRPAEIKKIEDSEAIEPVIASEPKTEELPRRDEVSTTKTDRIPGDKPNISNTSNTSNTPKIIPKVEEKKPEVKKPTIRRPWDKDPNVIRRPKR